MSTLGAGPASGAEVDWRARFLAEAPSAWNDYRRANRYLQGTCRGETQSSEGVSQRHEFSVKMNETCRSVQVVEKESTVVYGQNPKYIFRIQQGKDGGWALVKLYLADQFEDEGAKAITGRLDIYCSDTSESVLRLAPDNTDLGELIQSERTRVTSAVPKSIDGANLIEVQFECTLNPDDLRHLLGGTLFVDPSRSWLPVSRHSTVRNKVGTGVHTSHFDLASGINPQPSSVRYREDYKLNSQKEPWWRSGREDCDLRVPNPLPDTREFTLSHYGLPEPVGVKWEKPTPRYVWFLIATAAFAGVAVLFTYLARRARARRAPVA